VREKMTDQFVAGSWSNRRNRVNFLPEYLI